MNAPIHRPAVRTTCPYCGVGCGVLARPDGIGGATIAGDRDHPANFGRLCSKGAALGETLGLDTRLLHPMVQQPDKTMMRTSWDHAIERVADGFAQTIAQHGPGAIAFYLSGQLLTEDYYVANKLMKGFLGSANVDTNSRLCMASSVAGHRRAFGTDTVPGCYADLDLADVIVLVGSNAAWCHPVLYQRMIANKQQRGAKLVVIDPRRTATAEDADIFLPIAPGMDAALFCGLLVYLTDNAALDRDYIDRHTTGFAETLDRAREIAPDTATTSAICGLDREEVARFFALFLTTPKLVTAFSQGVNQSAQGTDKVAAIINCHLATGRIGKPGMGPFSLTGQPNAMGGREVGGLANQLAAHMNFTPADVDRVGRFWNAPSMAQHEGLKAVDMFDAIARGEIKALWVMATNPAVSLPRAQAVRDALRGLDLFVVSENVRSNDTVNTGAHILLPAAAWGEKDGTVTNSERRISRQRSFLPLPGEARPDWWIVTQVAHRLGFGASFQYRSPADIFREHAALSAFENDGARDFAIGALARLSDEAFNALEPVQWPACKTVLHSDHRFFAHGGFFTDDSRARFIAPETPALRTPPSAQFPLVLNTGRVRDQWHTMTRTGLSPRLANHIREPFVEIHPADAAALGLVDGGFADVKTADGTCVLKVVCSELQRRGALFVPIHWSEETASSARVGALVAPATDRWSGQPEAKATPAMIRPRAFQHRGFLLTRRPIRLPDETWWTRVPFSAGTGYLLASDAPLPAWRDRAAAMFGVTEFAEFSDESRGFYRMAVFNRDRLDGCLFLGPANCEPQWDAVMKLFEADALSPDQRRAMLSGRSTDTLPASGPLVCACFGVGLNLIRTTIEQGASSVAEIGAALRAGTNCGSCLPELKKIVNERHLAQTV